MMKKRTHAGLASFVLKATLLKRFVDICGMPDTCLVKDPSHRVYNGAPQLATTTNSIEKFTLQTYFEDKIVNSMLKCYHYKELISDDAFFRKILMNTSSNLILAKFTL